MKTLASAIAAVCFVSGCAVSSNAPTFSQAPTPDFRGGKAILYVYREHAEPTAWLANLRIDDDEAVSLPQKGFSWVYVSPGKRHFAFQWSPLAGMPKVAFDHELEANKVYVFEMKGRLAMVSARQLSIESGVNTVDPKAAVSIMSGCCRYVAPTKPTL